MTTYDPKSPEGQLLKIFDGVAQQAAAHATSSTGAEAAYSGRMNVAFTQLGDRLRSDGLDGLRGLLREEAGPAARLGLSPALTGGLANMVDEVAATGTLSAQGRVGIKRLLTDDFAAFNAGTAARAAATAAPFAHAAPPAAAVAHEAAPAVAAAAEGPAAASKRSFKLNRFHIAGAAMAALVAYGIGSPLIKRAFEEKPQPYASPTTPEGSFAQGVIADLGGAKGLSQPGIMKQLGIEKVDAMRIQQALNQSKPLQGKIATEVKAKGKSEIVLLQTSKDPSTYAAEDQVAEADRANKTRIKLNFGRDVIDVERKTPDGQETKATVLISPAVTAQMSSNPDQALLNQVRGLREARERAEAAARAGSGPKAPGS